MRAILVLAAYCATAWAQDPDDAAAKPASASVKAGMSSFREKCGFCHGPDARGASGPDLIRSELVSHDVDGNLIGPVVRGGRPAKGMPAFQLSDAAIRNLADFLHGEANAAASVARRIPTEYPLAKLLVGDARAGKRYFASHCASCHSAENDLAHIASRIKPFDLQTRIAFPSGLNRTAKVREGDRRAEGEVIYEDEFVITIRDKARWTHTFEKKTAQVEETDPLAGHFALLERYTDEDLHNVFAYVETLK